MISAPMESLTFDLSQVWVPAAECLTLATGPAQREIIREAEARGYDDLPVVQASTGAVVGFIPVVYAASLSDEGRYVAADDQVLKASFCPNPCTITGLLELLSDSRIVGVRENDTLKGIITISDLNRHSFRAFLYPMFARMEEQLARLIDGEFGDAWDWLPKLGDRKIGIVGHWECLKREGVDIGATAGASLPDLLMVLEASSSLLAKFSLELTDLKNFRRRVPKYRNAVMHPARPLIAKQSDVKSLQQFIQQLNRVASLGRG